MRVGLCRRRERIRRNRFERLDAAPRRRGVAKDAFPPVFRAREHPEFVVAREGGEVAPENLTQRDQIERAPERAAKCDKALELGRPLPFLSRFGGGSRGGRLGLLSLLVLMKSKRSDEHDQAGKQVDVVAQLDIARDVDDDVERLLENHQRARDKRNRQ